MRRYQQGFSLVELMISMVMFLLVISATTQFFSAQFDQFKKQSRIAESNVEGIVGLEMMRVDISHAGFGLPWDLNGATYLESVAESGQTPWVDRDFNDGPPTNPSRGTDAAGASNPPGAIRSGGDTTLGAGNTLNGSDVLVIKASNVGQNAVSQKWTRLGLGDDKRYDLSGDNFQNTDRLVVLYPVDRSLQLSDIDASWSTRYSNTAGFQNSGERINLIYGIKAPGISGIEPRFPFNRTDYYIKRPDNNMPTGCATGTGILYRGALKHFTGTSAPAGGQLLELPILDCVADFQVVYRLNDNSLQNESYTFDKTARQIRDEVRSVTVYILAHEGQKDPDFMYPEDQNPMTVGPNTGEGEDFNFDGTIEDWQNYRWKVYTVSATLLNLG